MAITVRKATRADAASLAEFSVALAAMHVAWDDRRFTPLISSEGATQFYGERTEAENAAVFVAEYDRQIVGFAYMEYEPVIYAELATKVAWLHDIYVEPTWQKLGAGLGLIEAVKDEARRLGADKILLTVADKNHGGQEFFRKNGFRTTMYEMMLEIEEQ